MRHSKLSAQSVRILIGLVLALSLVGCNSDRLKTYPVSGVVEFEDGSNPMFGDIEFYNKANKINARGKVDRDGTFVLGTYSEDDGAIEGSHQVIIIQRTRSHLTAQIEDQIKHDHGDLIHEKYYDYRTSDLVAVVQPIENNELKLVVKKASKKKQADADH